MTHTDSNTIILITTAAIASTLGVYAVIRIAIQYTRQPVNTLVRPGDIELGDFIEPTRAQHVYSYPDLLAPQPIYGRFPSLWSNNNNPPSYHTVDQFYISSCLETEINIQVFILWLILFLLFLVIIRKFLQNY